MITLPINIIIFIIIIKRGLTWPKCISRTMSSTVKCVGSDIIVVRRCLKTESDGSEVTPAQRAIHQLRLNRLTSSASYQAFIRQITSPICSHCGTGEETAEHLLLFCPKWAAERQRYFGDSIDITDVFQDNDNLVEFLISSGHLSFPYRHCLMGSS